MRSDRYCGLIPIVLITFVHFAASILIIEATSSGVFAGLRDPP